MKRPLQPEETRIWAVVARTVTPAAGRSLPALPPEPAEAPVTAEPARLVLHKPRLRPGHATPGEIEPSRLRRIARGRDALEARLDLHGLDQERARRILGEFLRRAQEEGARTVLVITGKGVSGDGVLKRRTPEWLGDPAIRPLVGGYAFADRRHGGEGALYVTLKRKAP